MVIADPAAELVRLVTEPGDPPPLVADPAAQRSAQLLRRRFGLALPPPFAAVGGGDAAVRVAGATDGPAIAAVKWRAFGTNYRGGVLPDHFLDGREVVPPPSFWVGRAMVPPSRRHRLLVWGRPGTVLGYLDAGPAHPLGGDDGGSDAASDAGGEGDVADVAEVYELYVDPAAQGHGGGSRLLAAATEWLAGVGFVRAELSTLVGNATARGFYEANGWSPTGQIIPVDLGVVSFREARYARTLGATAP